MPTMKSGHWCSWWSWLLFVNRFSLPADCPSAPYQTALSAVVWLCTSMVVLKGPFRVLDSRSKRAFVCMRCLQAPQAEQQPAVARSTVRGWSLLPLYRIIQLSCSFSPSKKCSFVASISGGTYLGECFTFWMRELVLEPLKSASCFWTSVNVFVSLDFTVRRDPTAAQLWFISATGLGESSRFRCCYGLLLVSSAHWQSGLEEYMIRVQ